uniref:Uncharacterized protein n=1 Tax=Anopheles albimanus TaxID=7167 RepID=A0A182F2L6_ANOAL
MASKMSRTTPTKGIVGRAEGFEDYLDALLADLQNTVPGHNQHGGGGGSSVPGYGSLNGVRNKQQQQQQQQQHPSPNQQTYQNITAKTVTESRATNGYNGSLPRATTPHNARSSTPQKLQTSASGNLSELDSLLQDLSSARYGNQVDKRKNQNANHPGRQVTITVRETTTEKLTGTPSAHYQDQMYQQQLAQNESHTSSATKELDDLMASLSDFKVE